MRSFLFLLASTVVWGQTPPPHPRFFLNSEVLTKARAERTANSDSWKILMGVSPRYVMYGCDWVSAEDTREPASPDGNHYPRVFAGPGNQNSNVNEPFPAGYAVPYFRDYYHSSDFKEAIQNLAFCYNVVKGIDNTAATRYLGMAKKIIGKWAVLPPTATYTQHADLGGTSVTRPITNVSTNATTGETTAVMRYTYAGTFPSSAASLKDVTIAGVLGCTNANGAKKAWWDGNLLHLYESDGVTKTTCNAVQTNYTPDYLGDAGYDIRNLGLGMVFAYDWLYDDLTTDERSNIIKIIEYSISEYERHKEAAAVTRYEFLYSNYQVGYMATLGLAGIAIKGDDSRGDAWYTKWRDTILLNSGLTYYSRWMGNEGQWMETWNYAGGSFIELTYAIVANYEVFGDNLTTHSTYPFLIYRGMAKFMMYAMSPSTDSRGYVMFAQGYLPGPSAGETGFRPNLWRFSFALSVYHMLKTFDGPTATLTKQFNKWIRDHYDGWRAITWTGFAPTDETFLGEPWEVVAYWDFNTPDPSEVAEWNTLPLARASMGSPAGSGTGTGGYNYVQMKSGWGETDVTATFTALPYVDDVQNGKDYPERGSLRVYRGGYALLGRGIEEASWALNRTAVDYFHKPETGYEGGKYSQSAWYITGPSYTSYAYASGLFGVPPGNDGWGLSKGVYHSPTVTSYPMRIDRFSAGTGATGATYLRATGLHGPTTYYLGSYSLAKKWNREILYLRPNLFVVHDVTERVDRPTVTFTDYIQWAVAKTPEVATAPAGQSRYHIIDNGTFRGAVTCVLPAGTATDNVAAGGFGGYNVLYGIQCNPPTPTLNNSWISVIDTATSSGAVVDAVVLTSTNAEVIQLGSNVVGFITPSTPVLPITYTFDGQFDTKHYISGLAVNTTYNVLAVGNQITIAASGSGTDLTTGDAGQLIYDGTGSGAMVTITTSSLSACTVDEACPRTITAGGGTPPRTFSITNGTLPTGLTMSSAGVISGTPTTPQSATFTVQACDVNAVCGDKVLVLNVTPIPLAMATTSVSAGVVGQAYSFTFSASGGTGGYSYAVSSGTLCTGLSLASNGTLSGTPTIEQQCPFTVRVTDSSLTTVTRDFTASMIMAPSAVTFQATRPAATGVVVRYSAARLKTSTLCTVSIYDMSSTLVTSQEDSGGPASRILLVSGLTANTQYSISVTCAGTTAPASLFRTASVIEGTATKTLLFKPIEKTGLARLYVEWGTSDYTVGNTTVSANTDGTYTVSIPNLTKGAYYQYRYQWRTAADVAVTGYSPKRYMTVQ